VTYIDEFRVTRGTNLSYFFDDFGDGLEPPSVPAGSFNCPTAPNCYVLSGTFNADDETGGKLRMDSALGGDAESALGTPRIFQRAQLITSRSDDLADIDAGLKQHRVFTSSAVFDLVLPGPGEQMQIRLTDPHINAADPGHRTDFLSLAVRRSLLAGAQPELRFFEQNYDAGTITEIDTTPLNTALGADQIRLVLAHTVADSTEVFASWQYLQGGSVVGNGSFATPGNIFDGETWTRADFSVSAPIPEPEAYALMLVGIGLLAWRLRRRALAPA